MYAKHQPTKERDKCALKIQSGFQGNWIHLASFIYFVWNLFIYSDTNRSVVTKRYQFATILKIMEFRTNIRRKKGYA